MKNHFLLSILILLPLIAFNQSSLFSKVYYSNSEEYLAKGMITTFDDGTVQIGAFNYGIPCVLRTDSLGEIIWQHSFSMSPTTQRDGVFFGIESITDSTFIITGSRKLANQVDENGLIVCMNILGDTMWTRTISATNFSNLVLKDCALLNDSTLILSGSDQVSNRNLVVQMYTNGTFISSHEINTTNTALVEDIARINDSTFAVSGRDEYNTLSFIGSFQTNGTENWSYTCIDYGISALEIKNDTLFAMTSQQGNSLGFITLSISGTILSSKLTLSSNSSIQDMSFVNSNELLLFCGSAYSSDSRFYLFNLSDSTAMEGVFYMKLVSAKKRAQNGYYFLGTGPIYGIKSEFYFMHTGLNKLDSLFLGSGCYDVFSTFTPYDALISLDSTNTTLTMNGLASIEGVYTNTLQLMQVDGCVDAYGDLDEHENDIFVLSPNPLAGDLNVTQIQSTQGILKIFSTDGKMLLNHVIIETNTYVAMNTFENGTYFYQITTENGTIQSGKLIVMN